MKVFDLMQKYLLHRKHVCKPDCQ